MLRIIILFFTTFYLSHNGHSQNTELSGMVKDSMTREAISFATLSVYQDADFIGGTMSDENGTYHLDIKRSFTHILVSSLGYKTLRIKNDDIKNARAFDVLLGLKAEMLQVVTVNGQRSRVEFKVDRKVINLGSDIQNSGVSALEAIDQILEIDVDQTNSTLSLRGSDHVQILVNGKPSPLVATELLEQLQVSSIDRIEIITSPSVKHSANGISGIINVIMRKDIDKGLNAHSNLFVGTRRYGLGLGGNHNSSNLNVRLNISGKKRKETNDQTIHRLYESGYSESILTPYQVDGGVSNLSTGFDFYVNDNHELTLGIDYTRDVHDLFNESRYINVSNRNDFSLIRKNAHKHKTFIVDANYRFILSDPQHFLEFDYQKNDSKNSYPIMDSEEGVLIVDQVLTEDFILHSVSMDYRIPLNDGSLFESGISLNENFLESSRMTNLVHGQANSEFTYKEHLFGMYGMYKKNISSFSLQLGLRYEKFNSESNTNAGSILTTKLFENLFPSAHITYQLNEHQALNLSYSKRISRPNFHHTNAFQIVSPLFEWEYNANIIPEKSHSIEVGYREFRDNFTLDITSFYRQRNDVILWTLAGRNNKQIFRYENSGKYQSYGLEGNLKFNMCSIWETVVSANYYRHVISEIIDVTWHSTHSSRINLKNTIIVGDGLTGDIVFSYFPKRQSEFSFSKNRSRIDFSLNWKPTSHIVVGMRMVDILDQNLFEQHSRAEGISQQTTWDIQYQSFNFLLNIGYTFSDIKSHQRNRKKRTYAQPLID